MTSRLIQVRWLAVIVALAALAPADVTAQLRVTRSVTYDVIIDPQTISLAKIQELRPENVIVDAWMTVIPDYEIPNSGDGARVITALKTQAGHISRTYSGEAEYNKVIGRSSDPTGALVGFTGTKFRLTAAFENNPEMEGKLKSEGFVVTDFKTFELEGDTFTLSRWIKRDGAAVPLYGTATSRLDITAAPVVDNLSSEFRGYFRPTDDSKISATGIPESGDKRALARERYEAFKAEANTQQKKVLTALNTPFDLFTDQELLKFAHKRAGVPFSFNRSIRYEWYGEEHTVNVVVTATLGPLRVLDEPGEILDEPFDDR